MEEEKGGGGEPARSSSSFVSAGGRQRFTVELRPGETTIVSWKKLVKDASKADRPISAVEKPLNAHPALESRLAPGQPDEKEATDAPPASRFSAVIEKIERLYMGKHSSDEEDLNDVPDDDEYDTEDSFIDDTELDEYFQVDNSAIKHDGFFINRGKLERIIEPASLPNQQPKKRRRKDLAKDLGETGDVHVPTKHVKVGEKAAGKSSPLGGKSIAGLSHVVALPSIHHEDMKFQNQMNSSTICVKKRSAETKTSLNLCPPNGSNGDAALSLAEGKNIDQHRIGVVPSKCEVNKLKDGGETSGPSSQKPNDKSSYTQCRAQAAKLSNTVDELEQSVQQRNKEEILEKPDLCVSGGNYSMQNVKAPLGQRKEGSTARPKSTILEKAIRELEKTVAESRPPSMGVQDGDISSQAVKRRLPRDVKLKLAKVARIAQASHGKISKELVNRLMSMLGHLIQLRTLKRNLKDMVNLGLSAKKEKDDRFHLMKNEIAELIKLRLPFIKSKALEHQAGLSEDFRQIGNEEKEVIKRKYSMDDMLEDKICDLYDLYVEGLDEDAGPPVRKLYAELAQLWPDGFMDNHGIKRAICRAKDRKRALYSRRKDQDKIKGKKLLIPKTEETVRVENSNAQPQYPQEKLVCDPNSAVIASLHGTVPNAISANMTVRMPTTVVNGPNFDRPKQDKGKGSYSNSNDTRTADILAKKKVKRKPESELGEAHLHPQKLVSVQGEERPKSHKQVAAPNQKPSLPVSVVATAAPTPPPKFEQAS